MLRVGLVLTLVACGSSPRSTVPPPTARPPAPTAQPTPAANDDAANAAWAAELDARKAKGYEPTTEEAARRAYWDMLLADRDVEKAARALDESRAALQKQMGALHATYEVDQKERPPLVEFVGRVKSFILGKGFTELTAIAGDVSNAKAAPMTGVRVPAGNILDVMIVGPQAATGFAATLTRLSTHQSLALESSVVEGWQVLRIGLPATTATEDYSFDVSSSEPAIHAIELVAFVKTP